MSLKTAYILLVFAILTEVLATSLLKAGNGTMFGYSCMFVLLAVSYYFMALSLKRLSVSVAYAIWEVLGAVCVLAVSIFYFGEELLWTQKAGIALSFCGIALINYAEVKTYKNETESLVQSHNNADSNAQKGVQ